MPGRNALLPPATPQLTKRCLRSKGKGAMQEKEGSYTASHASHSPDSCSSSQTCEVQATGGPGTALAAACQGWWVVDAALALSPP